MNENANILRIPKDPRTHKTVFLTGMPYILKNRLEENEWIEIVENLNNIIKKRESPSFINFIKTILFLPAILDSKGFENDVKKYLNEVNKKLKKLGIFIKDPGLNSYTELEIVISDQK